MSLASIALRAIPGAMIIDSGIGKIGMPADASAALRGFAATGAPVVTKIPADKFGTYLGYAETAIGGALLAPFVSNRVAGLGLTAFSAGLMSLYFANPANTKDDGIRPSENGLDLAKNSWLVAIGLALVAGVGEKSSK